MDNTNLDQLLLVGLPRSGTTWVAKLIDSHPDVIYRHEPDTEFRINAPVIICDDYEQYGKVISEYSENILGRRGVRVCGKQPFFSKSYFSFLTEKIFKVSVLMAKLGSRFGFNIKILEIVNFNNKNIKLLWKSIESAGRIGVILSYVPRLKAIYLVRSPYGQIASVLDGESKQKFTDSISSAEDYGFFDCLLKTTLAQTRGITQSDILGMTKVQKLALRWLLHNEHALSEVVKHPLSAIVIKYEDVCVEPEGQAKKIFNFLNLQWHQQTQYFISNKVDDDKYYSVFKSSINSMEKWRDKLSDDDVKQIDEIISGTQAGLLYGIG